jgi:DNA-binding CsgD family transcriptional regulator/tetratricopeptide (TPR) repeat protein
VKDWPFRGRAAELESLIGAVLDPASRAVAMTGHAGVGKTRLATEAIGALDARVAVIRVVATRSVAGVPLGAFAPVLPSLDSTSIDVDVLRGAHTELRRRADNQRLALFVDDAHTLDDISAGLIHHVAMDDESVVVLTTRSGEPLPDAVETLLKADTCTHLHLRALDEQSVNAVLTDALGAVDASTRQRLWSATEGNLLLLRELLEAGRTDGRLCERNGVWMWEGPLASARIVELFAVRLQVYDDQERRALELLALGEPLGLELLTNEIPLNVVERLERTGLLRVVPDQHRHNVVVAHPLYGDVVREQMGPLTRSNVSRQLADLVEDTGARRKEDLLRVATWRLDGGGHIDGGSLARAARAAILRQDLGLAERLARAAAEQGAAAEAVVHLTEALYWQGRHAEAEAMYEEFENVRVEPRVRRALRISRAGNLFWGLGRTADALTNLSPDDDWTTEERADATGQRALIEVMDGQVPASLATARSVLDGPDEWYGRARAAGAYVLGLATSGSTRAALGFADDAFAYALVLGDHDPMPVGTVLVGRVLALLIDAEGHAAEELTSSLETMAAADASDVYRGLWPLLTGRALLARGHLDQALAHLREASALLAVADPTQARSWCMGAVAQTAGQLGDVATAQKAAHEADTNQGVRWLWDTEIQVGQAWAHAAAGERSRAEATALEAVDYACQRGQFGNAVVVLHELSRLGAPGLALEHLQQIEVESDRAELARRSAAATLAGDGAELDELAERFADRGADLLAAECAAGAADAHMAHGLRARQLASRQRALGLLSLCGSARTPLLAALEAPELTYLTTREREVAELAGSGLTRNEIGDQLGVSDRTVANHLTHIYAKLNVSNRTELAKLLCLPSG